MAHLGNIFDSCLFTNYITRISQHNFVKGISFQRLIMGIHYNHKSKAGDRAMQKELKRKLRLEKKKKKRAEKEAEKLEELEQLTRPDNIENNKSDS